MVVKRAKPGQAFDYRRTFLRDHIEAELCRYDDVLCVRELIESHLPQLKEAGHEAECRRLLLQFLYAQHGDTGIYIPVEVFKRDEKKTNKPPFDSLTALLQSLREENSSKGVLLEARSGAGKTVAQRRAALDCLIPNQGTVVPALEGYLPCFAKLGSELPLDKKISSGLTKAEQLELILQLISGTADPAQWVHDPAGENWPATKLRLEYWLLHGPPLLLLVDLNALSDPSKRLALAAGLQHFQQKYGQFGHRVVVTYRSAAHDDGVLIDLGAADESAFERHDMIPLKPKQAEQYLRSLRAFEKKEIEHYGGTPPEHDIDAEVGVLVNLIRRHVRVPVGGTEEESPISTPLLMHLFSLIDGSKLASDATLAELYDAVVDKYLERELENKNDTNIRVANQWREWQLVAMTRLALLIQAKGPNQTRVKAEQFDLAIIEPAAGLPGAGGEIEWWPSDPFWHQASYYRNQLLPQPNQQEPCPTPEELRATGMFRFEGEDLGFVHDSFIYYFLGTYALRNARGPLNPLLPDGWATKTAERMFADPERWQTAAEFLGGSHNLPSTALRDLIIQLAIAEEPHGIPQLLLNLCQGNGQRDAVAKFLYEDHLRQGWWTLHNTEHAEGLLTDIHSRLQSSEIEEFKGYLDQIVNSANQRKDNRTWLRTLQPRLRDALVKRMDLHRGSVTCLAVLPDGRIASGSEDGIVLLWDAATGQATPIIRHKRVVTFLAVLPDGRLMSGSHDQTVQLWDLATGQATPMIRHEHWVSCLALLPDGRLASGSVDKTVQLWNPATGQATPIIEHISKVTCLAVSPNGRLVSGSYDGTLQLWDPSTGQAKPITSKSSPINCLAVLPDGRIASGGNYTVQLWDPATGHATPIIRHKREVTCLAVLPDGRLASGSNDQTVQLWDPATGQAIPIICHKREVTCLVALPDGRLVSGSNDGTVQLWDPAMGQATSIIRHESWVNCLAVLPDGRIASGSRDKTVQLWSSATGQATSNIRHVSAVTCLAVMPDWRVASGSDDQTVQLWDPATGQATPIIRHKGRATCLAVLPHRWLVSGSRDKTVQVWDLATGQVTTIIHYKQWVNCLIVLSDGQIVSGSDDGTVQLWDPASGRAMPIIRHKHWVNCLAVLPDGRIASGSYDKTVQLWDPATGQASPIILHEYAVTCLAVLPDGRLATGSEDKTVQLWDPATGHATPIIRHENAVTCLAVLSDGRLASGSVDKTVKIWCEISGLLLHTCLGSACLALVFHTQKHMLVAGLANGEVVMLAIEPEASRRREQRASQGWQNGFIWIKNILAVGLRCLRRWIDYK